jgi:Flp pilus assembly protein CpaB
MDPVPSALPTTTNRRDDAVTRAALTVVRRALVEGVPVTRESFAREASFALGATGEQALCEVDAAAQRLGISSLS